MSTVVENAGERKAVNSPKVVLVGCGEFALAAHIPALLRLHSENVVQFHGICGRTESSRGRAAKTAAPLQLKHYVRLEDVLADPVVDAVDLVLPISIMPAAVEAALTAEKHVVSEKPCAPSSADGLRLVELSARQSSSMWAVLENWRFKPTTTYIRDVVEWGEIGSVELGNFSYVTLVPPGAGAMWRRIPEFNGGHILDSGVHFIALLRTVIGEVELVSAIGSQNQPYLPPLDTVTAALKFSNGAEGSLALSFGIRPPDADRATLRLVGSKGSIDADFFASRVVVHGRTGRLVREFRDDGWVRGGVYEALRNAFTAVTHGEAPGAPPSVALRDVAVIEAILSSAQGGRAVVPSVCGGMMLPVTRELRTYARGYRFRPKYVVDCGTIADVQKAIIQAGSGGLKLRGLGRGNSWAPEITGSDVVLDLGRFHQVLRVDPRSKRVRVGAGVRLGDLTRALADENLCLPSLSFFPDVTVGGAISTATHGTSPRWGTLSDFVCEITLVDGRGEVRTISEATDPEGMRAARVSLGSMGVIVEVEFEAVDIPWVRPTERVLKFDHFVAAREEILRTQEHVWVHWRPAIEEVRVFGLESRESPASGFHRYIHDDNSCWLKPGEKTRLSTTFSRAVELLRRVKGNIIKPAGAPATPSPRGAEGWISMQYGVCGDVADAAMKRILDSSMPHRHPDRVVELKFLKGCERSYLGPNADGDAVLFNLWWFVEDSSSFEVFDEFESIMRDVHAKPHWGKRHKQVDDAYLSHAFKQWQRFKDTRTKFDPAGTFAVFA